MRGNLAVLGAAAVLSACASQLPDEPPRRILAMDSAVRVIVTGPAESVLFRVAPSGQPADVVGSPPIQIDTLPVTKEIWKTAGPGPPAVPETAFELSSQASRSSGPPVRYTLFVRDSRDAPLRLIDFVVLPSSLPAAFAVGRLELALSSAVERR